MTVLNRINPGSAFKVGFVAYALLGFIAGVFCSVMALAGVSFAPHAHLPFSGALGLLALVLCPLVYGTIGAVAALIGVLLYNLAAGWVGGLEVEIR